jgi:hypothetical protein
VVVLCRDGPLTLPHRWSCDPFSRLILSYCLSTLSRPILRYLAAFSSCSHEPRGLGKAGGRRKEEG